MSDELNKCGCGNNHEDKKDGCGCGNNHEDKKDGCGCGHDHGHDHDDEECGCGEDSMVIDLEDENGDVISCPIIDAFEFEGNEYILAQSPEDDSVYMFKSVGEELVVPDEEEFDRVSTYYNEELVEE